MFTDFQVLQHRNPVFCSDVHPRPQTRTLSQNPPADDIHGPAHPFLLFRPCPDRRQGLDVQRHPRHLYTRPERRPHLSKEPRLFQCIRNMVGLGPPIHHHTILVGGGGGGEGGSSASCAHRPFSALFCYRGLVGPTRLFGPGAPYSVFLYALLAGAVAPIPIWYYQRRHPDSRLKFVHLPVLLNGPSAAPPATGINYASFFLLGFLFRE